MADRLSKVFRNPLLSEECDDPRVKNAVEGSIDALARATRPAFVRNPDSPVTWTGSEWDRLEAGREDLFDFEAMRSSFDPERLLVEGYAIFEGVMTDRAREQWVKAAREGQRINDALLRGDWDEIAWQELGRDVPEKKLTEVEVEAAIGGSQQVPQADDDAGVLTLRNHSVLAEYFPAGHVGFLMDILTHPQMLGLQRMILDTDAVYFDHNQLLTRPGGYTGNGWHSHKIGGGHDDQGIADVNTYRLQPNTNLTICYPEGFEAEEDAGLKIVRGSHLFRDPTGCRFPDDAAMANGWMASKAHPVTGAPLQIERLELEPGSVVCCLSHAAHAVSPKAPGRKTRWSTLYCYKRADAKTGLVLPSHAIPPVWAMKAQRGELPDVLRELFRPSYDRELTQGLTDPYG